MTEILILQIRKRSHRLDSLHKITKLGKGRRFRQDSSRLTLTDRFQYVRGFPSSGKNPPANGGEAGLITGPERSPEGNGNPHQYSFLRNSMDRGTWWATSMGSQRVGHDSVTERAHTCTTLC